MRFVAPLADRLLRVLVPGVSAGACCPPDPYEVACGPCYTTRVSKHQSIRTCSYTCSCKIVCGSCTVVGYCI